MLAATEGLAAEVDRRADLRMLVRDVQRLPPDQRAALVLFEVGDHSHKEIAAVLGVRREKVKALVFQARETLMGWRTARETPCATVREQLATLARARARPRDDPPACRAVHGLRRLRGRRALPARRAGDRAAVAPAAGLRAAVLGSAAGGSGLGAAVGAGGATSAAGGLAGLGASGVAAKVLLVGALVGGIGVAGHAPSSRPQTAARPWRGAGAACDVGRPARRSGQSRPPRAPPPCCGRPRRAHRRPRGAPASRPVRPARGPEPHRTATVNKDVKQAEAAGKAVAPVS